MERFNLKNIPIEDTPEERLFSKGVEVLTDEELIALIIRTGNRSMTSVELSRLILNTFGREESPLIGLTKASLKDLTSINGIGKSKAAMIMAAVELGKRISRSSYNSKRRILTPDAMAELVMGELRFLDYEKFLVGMLNTKKELMCIRTISQGTLDRTIVHPRDVFKRAIEDSAHSIILVHNHPSGDPTPSKSDCDLTNNLVEVSKILDIKIVDHLIIGDNVFFSFLKEGLI